MEIVYLTIMVIIASFFCFLFIHFKWIVKIIREIASSVNPGGYTKLVQIVLMGLLCFTFALVTTYYLLTPERVDRMDLILTVIVGWLGFIIGKFFSEEAMQTLQEKQKGSVHHLVDKLKESKSILEQSEKMLSSIKDQREP